MGEYHRGEVSFSTRITGAHYLSTDGVTWDHLAEVVFVRCLQVSFSPFPHCSVWKVGTVHSLYLMSGEFYPLPLEGEDNIGFQLEINIYWLY